MVLFQSEEFILSYLHTYHLQLDEFWLFKTNFLWSLNKSIDSLITYKTAISLYNLSASTQEKDTGALGTWHGLREALPLCDDKWIKPGFMATHYSPISNHLP